MNRVRVALALLAIAMPVAAFAQSGQAEPARRSLRTVEAPAYRVRQPDERILMVGDSVRLFGGSAELAHGILVGVDSARLVIEPLGGELLITRPRMEITRIEALWDHPRRGVGSVLEGLLVGGPIGTLVGGRVMGPTGQVHELDGLARAAVGMLGALIGSGVGVGVSLTRPDRWLQVDPRTLSLLEAP